MNKMTGLLKQLYRRQKYITNTYLILLLISILLTSSIPLIIQYMVDSILLDNNTSSFSAFSVVIIIILSITPVLQFANVIINNRIINSSNIYLRECILNKIEKAKIAQLEEYGKGKLVQVIQNDVPVCQAIITSSFYQVFIQGLSFILVTSFLFYLNVQLTLIMLLIIPLYILSYIKFSKQAKNINENYLLNKDELSNVIQNIHSNFLILKKYAFQSQYFTNYLFRIERIYHWFHKKSKLNGVISLMHGGLQGLILMIIFIYGGSMVLELDFSIGAFVAYIMYSMNFFNPLNHLVSTSINIKASLVSVRRVSDFLNLQEENQGIKTNQPLRNGDISLKGLNLGMKNKELIHNLHLNFNSGKLNVVLGQNGIGKTTLVYNIYKYYEVLDNKISIDNIDINDYETKQLREDITIVFQRAKFISDSVDDYFNLKKHNQVLEPIVNKFIQQKKPVFNGKQYIQELSEGQKQLLLFLHAISSFPKVLIVDEAFSNLDQNTKQECLQILRQLQSVITIIIITHDETDFSSQDNIINLDKSLFKNSTIAFSQ